MSCDHVVPACAQARRAKAKAERDAMRAQIAADVSALHVLSVGLPSSENVVSVPSKMVVFVLVGEHRSLRQL